jgi:uncharacterized protein (TIGR03382 family)
MIELIAAALMGPTGVYEFHDKKPEVFGAVTRASDDHGVPVDGGAAPTIVLGLAAAYVLTRRRRPR